MSIECCCCRKIKPDDDFRQKNPNNFFCNCKECREKMRNPNQDYAKGKIKRICKLCKKEFKAKHSNQIYCSKECSKKAYSFEYQSENGGATVYYKLRFEIFKRDDFTCQYCGRNVKEDKIKLHIDHINPKKNGGEYKANNLTTSCEECNLGKFDVLLKKRELN